MTNEERIALKAQFDKECRIVNVAIEYGNDHVGEEKFIVATELSREELYGKYSLIVKELEPFAVTHPMFTSIQQEFIRNEHKNEYRIKNCNDFFGYDDELMAIFHPELRCQDELFYEKEERIMTEKIREMQREALAEGLLTLTKIQRSRVIAYYYDNKSSREIAKEEGVNYSAVDKSLAQAIKKLHIFIQNRVCISMSHCK